LGIWALRDNQKLVNEVDVKEVSNQAAMPPQHRPLHRSLLFVLVFSLNNDRFLVISLFPFVFFNPCIRFLDRFERCVFVVVLVMRNPPFQTE